VSHAKSSERRPKVIRVVTASYVLPWHLANTLKRMPADFETYVVGQGVSMYCETYPGVHWIDIELERKAALFSDLKAMFALCRIFRTVRPDIVHSIMPKAGLMSAIAGFLCRVPVRMHTFTGQVWATRTGVVRRLFRAVDRLIVGLNTLCMTDSPSQSDFLFWQGISFSGQPLPVLSRGSLSGVDIGRFHPDDAMRGKVRSSLGIPDDATVFLYLGRLSREKGILDLAKAFASLRDDSAHLILAGPDEEMTIAEALPQLGLCRERVHVTGFVAQAEQMFMAADVLCLPSYREGFGSVVIEAAACGVPAIGSRIPGLVDAIEDGVTGMLFPVRDVESLAICMRAMLRDSAKRRSMGEQARCRVERLFSADVMYQALRSRYFDLLKGEGMFAGASR